MSGIDNPPAFACASEGGHQAGMTLRDYYAGQVVSAIIAATCSGQHNLLLRGNETAVQGLARNAYELADAMLAERSRA